MSKNVKCCLCGLPVNGHTCRCVIVACVDAGADNPCKVCKRTLEPIPKDVLLKSQRATSAGHLS